MIPLFDSVLNFTDLRAFLSIAIKHRRLMLLCLCLGLSLGLAYMVYKRPVYYSKALIHVVSAAPLPVDAEVIFQDTRLESVIAQLNAQHIAERTAKTLGLPGRYGTLRSQYVKLQKINVNSERDLVLEVWPYEQWIARDWPAALVDAYLAYRDEKHFEQQERVVKSYQEELVKIRERIEEYSKAKQIFDETHAVDDNARKLSELLRVPWQLTAATEKLNFLATIKKKLETEKLTPTEHLSLLSSSRLRLGQLELGALVPGGAGATNEALAAGPDVIVTPDLVGVGEQWQQLEKKQQQLLDQIKEAAKVYLPGHQKMAALNAELEKITQEIETELTLARKRFDLDYSALLSEKQELDRRYQELQTLRKQNEAINKEYELRQAGRLSWEAMYKQLAQAVEKYAYVDTERTHLQFMGVTDISQTPVSPYRAKVMLIALAIGVLLAVGVPFVIEYLDDTISFDEQVERQLGIRTIGIIPEIERGPTVALDPAADTKDLDHKLAEYFRVIRVNLMSNVHFAGPRQLIMVTSSLPKEGKSMVSLNLAVAFAKLGEKTLLIDADLRRGTLHHAFNISGRPGLGQLLETPAPPLDTALYDTSVENLSFLPCGRHVRSASERIESDVFTGLMTELRGRFTRIVLDTPPVLGLAETSSMVKSADGVILVVWSGKTAMKAVKTAKGMLDANGAKFFGSVLNKLDMNNATTYYYYYYYSYKYYEAYHKPPEGGAPTGVLQPPLPEGGATHRKG